MATITRLATRKATSSTTAILIVVDGQTVTLTHAAIDGRSEQEIEALLAAAAGTTLPPFHVHRNRSGSLALAIGEPPATWPEDENGHAG